MKKRSAVSDAAFSNTGYTIFFCLMLFTFIYSACLEPKTLGSDIKFDIFIFWIPLLSGALFLGIYKRGFIINKLISGRDIETRIYSGTLLLVQGLAISYISFGQAALVSWNFVNSYEAEQNPKTTIKCNVVSFSKNKKSRYNSIKFILNNKEESVLAGKGVVERNINKNPDDYAIEVKVQKGIWGYYILDDWELYLK